jgi:Tol biopolymer transport system component
VAADGGEPQQMTRAGGYESAASADGRDIYYTKYRARGIFRAPVGGGEEVLVLDFKENDSWGDWALARDGIYFLDRSDLPRAGVRFFDFATRAVRRVVALERDPGPDPGLSLTPDDRWLVFSRNDLLNHDLMLVEHYR